MAGDRSDHGAEVEAGELLLQRQEPAALRRWPRVATLAALAAGAAALLFFPLSSGGVGQAGSSLVQLASGEASTGSYDSTYCPAAGANCTATRCCAEAGLQCYKKNAAWASCRRNCTKNESMPNDTNKDPWDCEEFGARTPEAVHSEEDDEDWSTGGLRGQDCRARSFCAGMDDHCYLKNKEWGSCMQKCDPTAALTKGWSCDVLY